MCEHEWALSPAPLIQRSAGEALLITAYTALALDVTPEAQRGARTSLDNQVGDVALLFLPVLCPGVLGPI